MAAVHCCMWALYCNRVALRNRAIVVFDLVLVSFPFEWAQFVPNWGAKRARLSMLDK